VSAPRDTPQQQAILRRHKTARKVRRDYPAGTRVESVPGPGLPGTGCFGTVRRHVPNSNAQGGYLTVEWDNGHTGRISPISLRRVDS
jgi:hypothetical protein